MMEHPLQALYDSIEAYAHSATVQTRGLESFDAVEQRAIALPNHRMGCHLINSRDADMEYIRRLQPPMTKIVDPDPGVVRRILGMIGSDKYVVLRDHPMSEQKSDMAKDPAGTGIRHALDWYGKLTTGRFKEFAGDKRVLVVGINEPDVHNENEERIVYEYTKAFLETLTKHKLSGLALNLSVGWPRNLGEGQPPTWKTFEPLEKIILDGNHWLCVHEYWYPTVTDKWGWYGNRISHCPMSVPIVIGECGYTRQLANLPQPWGWRGNIPATTYAEQLIYYHDNVDPNVFAIMPFTTGFASSEWESKDTQPAHADILARVHSYSFPSPWPVQKGDVSTEDKNLLIVPKYQGVASGYYGSLYKSNSGASYSHEGLDLPLKIGTSIVAPASGVVAWSDEEPTTYGQYIRLYHESLDLFTFFGHLSERKVRTGDIVKQGQVIALSGNSGNSSGPHLHLEFRLSRDGSYQTGISAKENARVDPIAWLAGWLAAGKKVEYR